MRQRTSRTRISAALAVAVVSACFSVPAAEAARPSPPSRAESPSDPLRPAAVEQQATNSVRVPDAHDLVALRTGRIYCKDGPHNFQAADGLGGRAFSATLDIPRFCHRRNQVGGVIPSTDHRLYGPYNFYMRFDHQSIERGYYDYHHRGIRSGYFVRAKFYFLYCFEPTRNFCTKSYIIYLRNYVHSDGTSSMFQTILGL